MKALSSSKYASIEEEIMARYKLLAVIFPNSTADDLLKYSSKYCVISTAELEAAVKEGKNSTEEKS